MKFMVMTGKSFKEKKYFLVFWWGQFLSDLAIEWFDKLAHWGIWPLHLKQIALVYIELNHKAVRSAILEGPAGYTVIKMVYSSSCGLGTPVLLFTLAYTRLRSCGMFRNLAAKLTLLVCYLYIFTIS